MWHWCNLSVLTLVVCLLPACYSYNDTNFFITPFINNSSCQSDACFTLSQFANLNISTENANITLIVLPGNHSLDTDLSLMDLTELLVTPWYSHQAEQPKIFCSLSASLYIKNVSMVHFVGMEFIGCQIINVSSTKHFFLWNVCIDYSTIFLLNDNYVAIEDSTFSNGQGVNSDHSGVQGKVGGAMVVIGSTTTITNSTFENNRADTGGALYIRDSNFIMNKCQFQRNVATIFGGGILALTTFILGKQCSYFGNSARYGGVFLAHQSEITVIDSHFDNNEADFSGGVLHVQQQSVVVINNSRMVQNHATMFGGVLTNIILSTVVLIESTFSNNTSELWGGVTHFEQDSTVNIARCAFELNLARAGGGVLSMFTSTLNVNSSTFSNNIANNGTEYIEYAGRLVPNSTTFGGVIYAFQSNISLYEGNILRNNKASAGGTIYILGSTNIPGSSIPGGLCNLNIVRNSFVNNSVVGGVILSIGCFVSDLDSTFQYNAPHRKSAQEFEFEVLGNVSMVTDAVIFATNSIVFLNKTRFISNSAEIGASLIIGSSIMISFNLLMESNNGSIYIQDSNVTFSGETIVMDCTVTQLFGGTRGGGGGCIYARHSVMQFHGTSKLIGNHAESGGAVRAIDSEVSFFGVAELAGNSAIQAGGAVILTRSDFTCLGICKISGNTANKTGGGIHASSSTVTIKSIPLGLPNQISFVGNTAEKGGGLYLQANSRLYIILPVLELTPTQSNVVTFVNNSAHLDGGAIYVADDTYSDTCLITAECFFQVQNTGAVNTDSEHTNIVKSNGSYVYLEFSNNSAIHGTVLYGGLLDRCTVSPSALLMITVMNGLQYFTNISGSEQLLDSISSNPVKVCFCTNRELNCSYQPPPIRVRKGAPFNMTVAAVDHIGHAVSADILSSPSPEAGLGNGQQIQSVTDNCTMLTFNVQSPHSEEHLIMYADGPCKDSELSQRELTVQFLECTCPIGFQPSDSTNTSCVCMCDPVLADYIRECDPSSGFLWRENTNSWISYTNQLGYIIHPHCPFDYCFPSTTRLSINLNHQNGSDAQCNFNRSGVLCGQCTTGYSLSLGSSECMNCQGSRWYGGLTGLLLISGIGGIVLVSLVLFLNITVAVGTISGFIFYANVIAANNGAFLRSVGQSFPSIFVAWINLDIGFNICIFDGNDAYAKTWIELIFPIYIFIIIVTIIVVSKYSRRFSNFIGMKNPIATLATLILLSYTKILRLMITMLSSTNIKYTNSSDEITVWRPDGNVIYLQDKHIALFLIALLILSVSVPFTLTLLCWQYLLRFSNKMFVRHLINTKVQSFVETYCVPFHAEHRYWTGMLLLVRMILYFIAGVEQSGDPQVQLVATAYLVGIILLIKGLVRRKVYESDKVDLLESLLLFNLLALSAFVLYNGDDPTAAIAAAYLSTIITFLLLIVTIGYHAVRYTPIYHRMGIEHFINEKPSLKVNRLDHPHSVPENRPHHPHGVPRDIDIFELMDHPPCTDAYRPQQEPPQLTPVVIEIPKSKMQPNAHQGEETGRISEVHGREDQEVRQCELDAQGVMAIKKYTENQKDHGQVDINQIAADDVVIPYAITDKMKN